MSSEKIFFSYSRENSEFVLNLAKELRTAGAEVWLDQLDIKPGTRWDKSIEDALRSSKTLLVILSKTSVASDNVMDEVSYALEEGKQVVPVLMEECEIPFRLRRLQFADFAESHEKGMETLTEALGLGEKAPLNLTTDQQRPKDTVSTPSQANESAKMSPKPSVSSSRKKLLILGGAIIIILGALYVADIINFEDSSDDFVVDMIEGAATEEEAWANAQSIHTIKGYLDYMAKYSEGGIFLEEAGIYIDSLYNAEGVVQYSETSDGDKENYFQIYKGGFDDETNTPEVGQYIISLMDNVVNSSLVGGDVDSEHIIKQDEVATVLQVQNVNGVVFCKILYHQE
ncbi:MAG: toll/interleukin-1 receptor domain-containing protein [Flavobacteriaceae bacterium]|nr:toll/interleukin-1 receptor domain-containing protein [Flavobacteriaceae bacterium]